MSETSYRGVIARQGEDGFVAYWRSDLRHPAPEAALAELDRIPVLDDEVQRFVETREAETIGGRRWVGEWCRTGPSRPTTEGSGATNY